MCDGLAVVYVLGPPRILHECHLLDLKNMKSTRFQKRRDKYTAIEWLRFTSEGEDPRTLTRMSDVFKTILVCAVMT